MTVPQLIGYIHPLLWGSTVGHPSKSWASCFNQFQCFVTQSESSIDGWNSLPRDCTDWLRKHQCVQEWSQYYEKRFDGLFMDWLVCLALASQGSHVSEDPLHRGIATGVDNDQFIPPIISPSKLYGVKWRQNGYSTVLSPQNFYTLKTNFWLRPCIWSLEQVRPHLVS